jgi:hypothetical protein
MQSPVENRLRLLAGLDSVERVLVAVGRLFLGLLIVAILGGTAFVIVRRPWGAGNQGEWFYFGIAVLLALGWAVGQYMALGRRQRRGEWPVSVRVKQEADGQSWELKFGSARDTDGESGAADGLHVDLSRNLHLAVGSRARDVLPDEAALTRLQAELATGADLDEACRSIQPAYVDWNVLARWAYRKYVANALGQRRGDTAHQFDD